MYLVFLLYETGTPTKKASEFLDYNLQPIMRASMSFIKETKDLKKVPGNAVLVTAMFLSSILVSHIIKA